MLIQQRHMALYVQKPSVVMLAMQFQQSFTDLAQNLPRTAAIIHKCGFPSIPGVDPSKD